jgi:hypothetical protein
MDKFLISDVCRLLVRDGKFDKPSFIGIGISLDAMHAWLGDELRDCGHVDGNYGQTLEIIDAFLEALHGAGYLIVRRSAP